LHISNGLFLSLSLPFLCSFAQNTFSVIRIVPFFL
jgi:hypothetical protein